MGETTKIAWAHSTFNPWLGCERVSPGCDFCYAETGSKRFAAQHGLQLWSGDRHVTSDSYWREPLKWERVAAATGRPHRVFCGSWCDWAEDHIVARATRCRLLELIYCTPHLTWMLLTKRPENIREALHQHVAGLQMDNIWLGTTCEDQRRLDERLPALLAVPAAVHFVSAEPLLESITLRDWRPEWVICGGESGPRARPFDFSWAASLKAECWFNRIPFFMKQAGDNPLNLGGPIGPADDSTLWARHGDAIEQWPFPLRLQEFPS